MSKTKKDNWYTKLVEQINIQLNHAGVEDEELRADMKDFIVKTAKEQYMAGNRSGIRWMRKQMNAEEKATA